MPLTDVAVRSATAGTKTKKLYDERGMFLEIPPSGGKWWRLKYRYLGKEKKLALGVYPDISLRDAREARDKARTLLAKGIDPGAQRKAIKQAVVSAQANTFEVVGREWFEKMRGDWAEAHSSRILAMLERDFFPFIGGRPIADITTVEILGVIRRVEARALDTAHRSVWTVSQIFRYGVITKRCEGDPARDLTDALAPRRPKKHFASTTNPKRLGEIMTLIDNYAATPQVTAAVKLAPRVFVRPGELRKARWADFDLDKAVWEFILSKTKAPHIVPLSTQSLDILRELHRFTGRGELVFASPSNKKKPISENSVLVAMRSRGITKDEMVGHGFRAAARTILDEVLNIRPDFIEHQLGHAVRDPNGRAYNRTAHLDERRKMMQAWADHLDALKTGMKTPDR